MIRLIQKGQKSVDGLNVRTLQDTQLVNRAIRQFFVGRAQRMQNQAQKARRAQKIMRKLDRVRRFRAVIRPTI